MPKLMVGWRVETLDGSVYRGTCAVHAETADAACRQVSGLIRGHSIKYGHRPECFADFSPEGVDDISVTCLGLA